MLIDTHCHLDAAEFNVDRDYIALMAKQQGVNRCLLYTSDAADE